MAFSQYSTVDRWYPRTMGGEMYALNETVTKQQLKMLWRPWEQEKRKECLGFTE